MSSSTSNFNALRAARFWLTAGVTAAAVACGCALLLQKVYGLPTWQSLAVEALGPEVEILVLGSSRVHYGIDPQRYAPRLVSLPGNYLNALEMERLQERYAGRLTGLRLVVLEAGTVTLRYDTLKINPAATVRLGLCPWPAWPDIVRDPDAAVRRMLWPFFLWRLTPQAYRDFMTDYRSSIEPKGAIPGFIPSRLRLTNPGRRVEVELPKAVAAVNDARPGILADNKAALARVIAYFNGRDVPVLLLRLPKHAALQRVYPPKWDGIVRETMNALQSDGLRFTFSDHSRDGGYEDGDFRDPDHLNQEGAAKFALSLAPELEELMAKGAQPQPIR
jgi:hypothetical protein